MTPLQKRVLGFISGFWFDHGMSPSFDEIAEACRLSSKSSVSRVLDALERRGFVQRRRGEGRSIVVTAPGDRTHIVRAANKVVDTAEPAAASGKILVDATAFAKLKSAVNGARRNLLAS